MNIKKIITIIAVALSTLIKGQTLHCDSIAWPPISIVVSTHTFCTPGTFNGAGSLYRSEHVRPEYADTLTSEWNINGSAFTPTANFLFTASAPGTFDFVLKANNVIAACSQTFAFTFTVYDCEDSVSTIIEEYKLNNPTLTSTYFNIYGEQVPYQTGTVLIEKIGIYSRKIYIQ